MFVACAEEMREIDERAIKVYGIPGIVLMENAAAAVLRRIIRLNPQKVIVLCGTGNNGGDGFALSRLLFVNGFNVKVYCFGDVFRIFGDARINYDIMKNIGIDVKSDINDLRFEIENCDVVVDAIFGTGFKGELKGIYKEVIDFVNEKAKYIISVDIPSGIDSDTGAGSNTYIKANETVTFGCMKYGHLLLEGREAAGKVTVNNISIPESCIKSQNINASTNYDEYPLCLIKKRKLDSNKGDFGRVYIVGGSNDMSGAVSLCARASLRSGCGLVTCVIPGSILERVGTLVPEATYMACSENRGCISIEKENIDKILQKADSIAYGTGLGREPFLSEQLKYLIETSNKPLIIDADGINILSSMKDILRHAKSRVILTPHPGEMTRLTNFTTEYINRNRVRVALDFSREYKCITVLKGSSTIVTDGVRIYINTSGNPGMATGGSGDVLTGVIASLAAQGYDEYEAAVLGVHIHGTAGNDAYNQYGFGLTAGDIVEYLGKHIKM